ncbi:hypothetical protein CVT24_012509 [Panaeolus cyanescens]|uniref:Protein farnesyltransferase/geranylgeranyltransferase type-1 subunit alpha n=1 Tax=Panaeolus cyanescens TaxID=181874 RepID=A0A409YLB5_9AGAR|nr:hypothetical protein CVT24_012509 [Panaeolus cyanescens]
MSETKPLYSKRPEWSDVVPVEQYEIVNPVAPIFYSEQYKDATNYFRAITKMGEKSPRVLELTESIIRQNPAHYTAWQYRYETLCATNASLADELKLMDEIAIKHLKTYQVWHHRRLLLTTLRKPKPELEFIKKVLHEDTKNYHTWSYRQWLLAHFGADGASINKDGEEEYDLADLWEGELDFVDSMLNQDVRNNSAWHHRFFVVWGCGIREGEQDRERVFKRELIYVKQNISLAPNNPSAWNYLRGILKSTKTPLSSVSTFVLPYTRPRDPTASRDIVDLENPPPSEGADLPSVQAVEFLADILEEKGSESDINQAVELWKSLATELDTIRRKYWEHRIRDAHLKLKASK